MSERHQGNKYNMLVADDDGKLITLKTMGRSKKNEFNNPGNERLGLSKCWSVPSDMSHEDFIQMVMTQRPSKSHLIRYSGSHTNLLSSRQLKTRDRLRKKLAQRKRKASSISK